MNNGLWIWVTRTSLRLFSCQFALIQAVDLGDTDLPTTLSCQFALIQAVDLGDTDLPTTLQLSIRFDSGCGSG
ncbi:hypothetical protein ACOMHN_031603 [Nucella lapillus]